MSATDDLLRNNAAYAEGFDAGGLGAPPARQVAIVACMDARLDVYRMLGLREGEAHVIRNAGGVVTDDVIRSLMISQRKLGTQEIVLIHHTQCGMTSFSEDAEKAEILGETGIRPPFALEAFDDPHDDVRQSMRRIRASPFISRKETIRGFVYDVDSGRLEEVEQPV